MNIERGTSLNVLRGTVTERIRNLKPAQRSEIFYEIDERTDQVVISVSNFIGSAVQNSLFGDDLLVTVHTAKTSQISFGDYTNFAFTRNATLVVDKPEPGVMRITTSADWFNAGLVSADITVSSTQDLIPKPNAQGRIDNHGTVDFPVDIPGGATKLEFQLSWTHDWSYYPTSDVDFGQGACGVPLVLDPDGNRIVPLIIPAHPLDPKPGLDAPQRASVAAQPGKTLKQGRWHVLAFGCDIPPDNETPDKDKSDKDKSGKDKSDKDKSGKDKPDKDKSGKGQSKVASDQLELRVSVDGKPLK